MQSINYSHSWIFARTCRFCNPSSLDKEEYKRKKEFIKE